MRVLIDMNLSPGRVEVFERYGWGAVHWSEVGDPRAPDSVIMDWATANQYVVFTHDLDFSTLLAATGAHGPSIIQVRAHDVLPDQMEATIIGAIQQHEALIEAGVLISVDESASRTRILPL